MIQRPKYIQRSKDGDYVMRCTGLTWSVLRRTGEEGAFILSTGHRDRKAALSQVQSLTERRRREEAADFIDVNLQTQHRSGVSLRAWLGIVHVLSHSRHRQYVATVMVVARVSTALPWQKGQLAGRALPSAAGESGIVIVSSAARVERDEFEVYQSRKVVSIRSEEIFLGRSVEEIP